MILLIAIILFIIFLIYIIKPRSEGYTLEGLKLSWKNKASIEGIVDKWIVILKDKSGTKIHEYENSDAGNLKDFTDVTMNIVDKKEFDEKIIGDNTLELYYNDIKPDTKLYTKTVTFTEDDFGMSLDTSNLEEIDVPEPEGQQLHNQKMVVKHVLLLHQKPKTVIHRGVKLTVTGIGVVGVPVPKHVVVEQNIEHGEQLHNQKMVVQRVRQLKHKVVTHGDAVEHHLNLRQEGGGGGGVNNVL
jgi:hypothetical protein